MDESEVYLATCKTTGLRYVGVANKYLENGAPWGITHRWTAHIRDAAYEKTKHMNCSLFHQALNEYGSDDFTVDKICDCKIIESDAMEQKYIAEYNTVHPNGYNMSTGGRKTTFCEEARKNMAEGQLGKRYNHEIERKHTEDKDLPKNITPMRHEGEVIGYQVKKFPIGVDKKEYVYKSFKNKHNLEQALQDATQFLEEMKLEYQRRLEAKKEEGASTSKAAELKLPKNIFPIGSGYFVKGLKDYGDQDIPRQDFDTLESAQEFIIKVNEFNDAKKLPFRWEIVNKTAAQIDELLSQFVEKSTYAKVHNGYIVQHVTSYDEKNKPNKVLKRFTERTKSIEEKYQEAITYIKEIISGSWKQAA